MRSWIILVPLAVLLVVFGCDWALTQDSLEPSGKNAENAKMAPEASMSDNWDFYFCYVDKEPASIFVDLGVRVEAPVSDLPDLVWLRLYMRSPRPDGLSSNEEFEMLRSIEDELSEVTHSSDTVIKYVGRNTSGGSRDFYFYSEDGNRAVELLSTVMASRSEYECEFGSRKDPAWEAYLSFLYPSDRDRQVIENRRILVALEEHGDDHSISRPVQHWAYFKSADQRAAFANEISSIGFEIKTQTELGESDAFPYGISFVRDSTVDEESINNLVLDLVDRTTKHGGDYDGWETSVENGK
jgi:uncharacterized protein (TIGR01619 family)